MATDRLSFAFQHGGLTLPTEGTIALFGAPGDALLTELDAQRVQVIQTFRPDFDAWMARGLDCVTNPQGPYAASIVTLPRARELALSRIAEAASATLPGGPVVIDGARTDGADAVLKALRDRVPLLGHLSKAHGRVFWFAAGAADLSDWRATPRRTPDGFLTTAGVFSADGADPGSLALAQALPPALGARVADLGGGWGYLSAQVLGRAGLQALHVVEAEGLALDCARANLHDARVSFHWADATTWTAPTPLDAVVMNPPFHKSRNADPDLGRAFVRAAARLLTGSGRLWMVANRHLPYETVLAECFRTVQTLDGTPAFKLFCASQPLRPKR